MIEQELTTIVSTIKKYAYFILSHRAEGKWKKTIADTTSVHRKVTGDSFPTFPNICLHHLPT